MRTNFVVFQAYGIEEILNEALVSIASIYKVTNEDNRPEIVVFTDSKSYLAPLLPPDIQFVDTPKYKWEAWKGKAGFVHRAKIEMLREFCEQHIGNVLYCDTDTYFMNDPTSIFQKINEGIFVMHTDEGRMKGSYNLVFRKLGKFLQGYQNANHALSDELHMWNAGVLGFRTAKKEILDEVLALSDHLYEAYPKHVMEQFAFSVCFGKGERVACDKIIFHYWDFKEYRGLLGHFFTQYRKATFVRWKDALDDISPVEIYKAKLQFMSKPYLWRKILHLFGADDYLAKYR